MQITVKSEKSDGDDPLKYSKEEVYSDDSEGCEVDLQIDAKNPEQFIVPSARFNIEDWKKVENLINDSKVRIKKLDGNSRNNSVHNSSFNSCKNNYV